MTELVLDASVVLKWFHSQDEPNVEQARSVRAQFETGALSAFAPSLLWLEVVNVAARRWKWGKPQLEELATTLPNLGFELFEPALSAVARWTATGLTAYDAAYVAIAEQTGAKLLTDDEEIVSLAQAHVIALVDWKPPDEDKADPAEHVHTGEIVKQPPSG